MDVTQYRRAYFALCRALGLDDATRRAFNLAVTGKESSTAFSVDDWRLVVSELQRRAGQPVQPGRPRIRGHGGCRVSGVGPDTRSLTPAQLEFVVALSEKIPWRSSPEAFVRARLLNPFRRDHWSGRWEDLTKSEAGNVITTLLHMQERLKPKTETEPCNASHP